MSYWSLRRLRWMFFECLGFSRESSFLLCLSPPFLLLCLCFLTDSSDDDPLFPFFDSLKDLFFNFGTFLFLIFFFDFFGDSFFFSFFFCLTDFGCFLVFLFIIFFFGDEEDKDVEDELIVIESESLVSLEDEEFDIYL